MAAFLVVKIFLLTAVMAGFAQGKFTDRQMSESFSLEKVEKLRGETRQKRSDDINTLQVMVDHLAQQMTHLQAQVQANKNAIDLSDDPMVGFTVRTKQTGMTGCGLHQVVKFDNVIFNAGNGYRPSTGVFTAPLTGTYVFYLQTLRHSDTSEKVFLDIMKNDAFLTRAHAGFSRYENGSTLAVTHLNKGDTIKVEVAYGSEFFGGVFTTFSGFRVSPH